MWSPRADFDSLVVLLFVLIWVCVPTRPPAIGDDWPILAIYLGWRWASHSNLSLSPTVVYQRLCDYKLRKSLFKSRMTFRNRHRREWRLRLWQPRRSADPPRRNPPVCYVQPRLQGTRVIQCADQCPCCGFRVHRKKFVQGLYSR
jgi:hypothetical protein